MDNFHSFQGGVDQTPTTNWLNMNLMATFSLDRPRRDVTYQCMLGSREGGGGRGQGVRTIPPPVKNHGNIGFLSNTGPEPLENHKATKPAFNVGPPLVRQRGPLSVVFGSSLPSSTKKHCQMCTTFDKTSGSAHASHRGLGHTWANAH